MRSRAFQLVLSAMAAAAIVAAALFITTSEQQIATSRTAERAFDAVVRETTNSVAEFRTEGVGKSIDALRSMATTDKARASLDRASAKAANFTEIAAVLDQVNAARMAEQQAADAAEAARRKLEAIVLGGAAVVVLATIAGMLIATPASAAQPVPAAAADTRDASIDQRGAADLLLRDDSAPRIPGYVTARPAGPVLRAASQLCTDLGRVSDVEELRGLVGRAAELMDASGLIVWTGDQEGSHLLPALSHGYAPDVLARFPPLARSAENAAAKAFRTAQLQIVLARPGESNGAIVAPVLSPNGCVGVISAEIRGGGETSESVQALAAIFAAQLAGVLHSTPAAHEQRATGTDNA
jgi:hypothetical protein